MTLELTGNQVVDVTPLTAQTELSLLLLDKNKVVSLTPLVKWAKADGNSADRYRTLSASLPGG